MTKPLSAEELEELKLDIDAAPHRPWRTGRMVTYVIIAVFSVLLTLVLVRLHKRKNSVTYLARKSREKTGKPATVTFNRWIDGMPVTIDVEDIYAFSPFGGHTLIRMRGYGAETFKGTARENWKIVNEAVQRALQETPEDER